MKKFFIYDNAFLFPAFLLDNQFSDGSKGSCFSACSAFSCCEDDSDDLQTLYIPDCLLDGLLGESRRMLGGPGPSSGFAGSYLSTP